MDKLSSYVLPKSATWWAGLASLCLGSILVWFPSDPTIAKLAVIWGAIINVQDIGGLGFIAFGAMAIGVRAKLERILPDGWVFVEGDEDRTVI